ncbi:TPA: TetR/AcrR family transcriptional regulator, partial [Pseudomonas aeruginosa]|nr:TetR/AcrR family transcriptional regulator [Pseudomonas aeruginosa]HBP1742681.1 TetR/AcrR family transcriptional regulator [Pseudomonas aeruginosa]
MMQKSDDTSSTTLSKPGRGRPRAFDREAALAAATRLFWQKGYAATSISDLTETMGIGSPSLYAAFGSKEALYGEALRYYGENYEERVWGNFAKAKTAREAIEAFLTDSAAALTGSAGRVEPLGCMVTLSAVGNEGQAELRIGISNGLVCEKPGKPDSALGGQPMPAWMAWNWRL